MNNLPPVLDAHPDPRSTSHNQNQDNSPPRARNRHFLQEAPSQVIDHLLFSVPQGSPEHAALAEQARSNEPAVQSARIKLKAYKYYPNKGNSYDRDSIAKCYDELMIEAMQIDSINTKFNALNVSVGRTPSCWI